MPRTSSPDELPPSSSEHEYMNRAAMKATIVINFRVENTGVRPSCPIVPRTWIIQARTLGAVPNRAARLRVSFARSLGQLRDFSREPRLSGANDRCGVRTATLLQARIHPRNTKGGVAHRAPPNSSAGTGDRR